MRRYTWLLLSMGLTFSLVGCGDSEDGSGGSAGSGGSGGGSGGASTATVSGVVYVAIAGDGEPPPLEGATVEVVGTSSRTTSDVNGAFSLESPVGFAALRATADGHWGELLPGNVPAGGLTGLEPELVPDALVAEIEDALTETVDPGKGIVAVEFPEGTTVGGETAALGVAYGFAFTFNGAEEPVPSTTLIAGGGNEVIFVNVDLSGDVMPTAQDASAADCSTEFPGATYPSEAKVITAVSVTCP